MDARVADLEKGEFRIEPVVWDLIVIYRYVHRDLFEPAKLGVRPGGVLLAVVLPAKSRVRHPPQSGWLDEWDRLKGGHLLSLGVALEARLW